METEADIILNLVEESASSMGGCDPIWLRKRYLPEFKTVEAIKEDSVGQDILMLHGLMGALSNWDSTLPFLADFSNPICLQLPILTGHSSEIKVKALAVYAEAFVRLRKLQPISLCGNSLGGHVALRLALARPELVDCLILSGSSGLYEHTVDSLPLRPSKEYIREHMGRVFSQQKFVTNEAVDEIYTVLSSKLRLLSIINAARSAKKDNLLERLSEIQAPTLLLWGEEDQVTTMQVAEMFHKNIPNSTLLTVKNCGHAPMIEHPEWFAEQCRLFLEKNSKKK